MEKLSIESLDSYYKKLVDAFNSKKESIVINDDRAHNAMVMRCMMENSDHIDMYCGKMSIFRKSFYDAISDCHSVEIADSIREQIVNAFKTFIEKDNSSINIIFEDFKRDYLHDVILGDYFKMFIQRGKVSLFKLGDDSFLKDSINHFCFSNTRIIRRELDKEKHNATCTMNSQDEYDFASRNFDRIKAFSKTIEHAC